MFSLSLIVGIDSGLRWGGRLLSRALRLRGNLAGFSLLEMSIVLLIVGVIMGSGVVMLSGTIERKAVEETVRRQQVIKKALLDFRRAFNRLPCPGDLTLAISSENFGVEGGRTDQGSYVTCYKGDPVATFQYPSFEDYGYGVEAGSVPTRTLQLPDEYMFDGWGRRMVYAVSENHLIDNAFTIYDITDTSSPITVYTDESLAVPRAQNVVYALISYGKNGHGAYSHDGSTRISTGSTLSDEYANCDCGDDASTRGSYLYIVLVDHEPTQSTTTVTDRYDDILAYVTRQDLRTEKE